MININNIGKLKKCRVWLEELPLYEYKPAKVLSSILETSICMSRENQKIAIEIFVAPRYYAFLGAEYVYKESNNLEIHVNVSNDSGEIITETLALPSDKVHLGISNEYAQTILNTSMEVFMKLSVIPSGILTFNIGGFSDYGSNQVIFKKVTSIIVRLLVSNIKNTEIDKIENIVKNEVDKPLTDI
ncbi:hypothetical protein [Acetivibrio straminisolvens]|jgi:hypothetical protein|uniref:Uncharacterized protein n=1 Tax=Acetivibrio straminisolvens JCM 21531 TaxID=1294263 RepID=W4VC16_9FIRM|nr:hypothetical protein [Acetivibrio straminisolvens]GAE90741.1 hypothetical protein JCM21531_4378 [Acetivibrio straminisolvens JCM 21531]